jgi:imidazolonepropionase-like amidohydrolase
MGDPGPEQGVANSPEECRKAVRQRYKEGSDLIKITATGGVLSLAKDASGPAVYGRRTESNHRNGAGLRV